MKSRPRFSSREPYLTLPFSPVSGTSGYPAVAASSPIATLPPSLRLSVPEFGIAHRRPRLVVLPRSPSSRINGFVCDERRICAFAFCIVHKYLLSNSHSVQRAVSVHHADQIAQMIMYVVNIFVALTDLAIKGKPRTKQRELFSTPLSQIISDLGRGRRTFQIFRLDQQNSPIETGRSRIHPVCIDLDKALIRNHMRNVLDLVAGGELVDVLQVVEFRRKYHRGQNALQHCP